MPVKRKSTRTTKLKLSEKKEQKPSRASTPAANHEEDERGKGRENKKRTWNEDPWTHQVYCQYQLMSKPTNKSAFFFLESRWRES